MVFTDLPICKITTGKTPQMTEFGVRTTATQAATKRWRQLSLPVTTEKPCLLRKKMFGGRDYLLKLVSGPPFVIT